MKRLICTFCIALAAFQTAFGWGQKGHDVVAYIAECNLKPEAYQRVTAILNGHSPVYYANWMDSASNSPEYRYTKTWHYANVDKGKSYETMTKNPQGDILTAIDDIVTKLKSKSLTAEQESVNLRFLIHLVGDIHAPMHAGRLSDRGGNDIDVIFFDKKTSLHSLWDTAIVEFVHRWSYTEWQQQLDKILTAEQRAAIAKGTPRDWFEESHKAAQELYIASPKGQKLWYQYANYSAPIVEQRLLAGGLRLAMLLNEIYGN